MSIKIEKGREKTPEELHAEAVENAAKNLFKRRVDVPFCLQNEPPKRDFVFNGLRVGKVGCLYAPGAHSKSYFALQVAMSVAIGRDIIGFTSAFKNAGPAKSIYFSSEDDEEELHSRLYSIAQHHQLTESEISLYEKNIFLVDMTGKENINILDAVFFEALLAVVAKIKKEDDVGPRLMIFDTLSQFHSADENLNKEMKPVINRFKRMAKELHSAVLYLHHNAKQAGLNGDGKKQQSARGASCIIDDARWGGYLQKIDMKNEEWRYLRNIRENRIANEDDFPLIKDLLIFGDGKINSGREREVVLSKNEYGVVGKSIFRFLTDDEVDGSTAPKKPFVKSATKGRL